MNQTLDDSSSLLPAIWEGVSRGALNRIPAILQSKAVCTKGREYIVQIRHTAQDDGAHAMVAANVNIRGKIF